MLGDVDQYAAFITRGPVDPNFPTLPGPITAITTLFTNLGETRIEGFDVDLRYRTPSTSVGRFRFGLQGTYYTQVRRPADRRQLRRAGRPATRGSAARSTAGSTTRRSTGSTGRGARRSRRPSAAATPTRTRTCNGNPRRVGNYEVYDLQGRWTGVKNLTVTLGVKNLFDRAPPFTNQTFAFQNGYDPSYADPRGAFWYGNVGYKFF